MNQAEFFQRLLASKKAEALGWLCVRSDDAFRTLGEMDTPESVSFVERLYAAGATKVWAVKIEEYAEGENTGLLVVEAPNDPRRRSELFAFEARHAESRGFCGEDDAGQPYLFFQLD
jgi:hypothetical protein